MTDHEPVFFPRFTRFTFQVAFWDALKTLDDGAARRAGSLARLMAHLVVRKQLSLTVLKVMNGSCSAAARVSYRVFLLPNSVATWYLVPMKSVSAFLRCCPGFLFSASITGVLWLAMPHSSCRTAGTFILFRSVAPPTGNQTAPTPRLMSRLPMMRRFHALMPVFGPLKSQTVDVQELSPSGLLLMRVFFHEIIAAGDDAAFMEVHAISPTREW